MFTPSETFGLYLHLPPCYLLLSPLFTCESLIEYSKQNKKQYLGNLARVFKANKRINVSFDEISVVKHPAKEAFYGVTLKQGWSSDNYSDDGYVFLLWDFTNPEAPQIHVRTWQPEKYDNGTPIEEEEIFTIDDFEV